MQREKNSKMELTFSGKIKEELSRNKNLARHCQIAEIAAITSMCGKVLISSKEEYAIKIHTENLSVARKYFTLVEKTFNIETESLVTRNRSNENITYTVVVRKHDDAIRVLRASKLIDEYGEVGEEFSLGRNLLLQQPCCKRAFIRGAFLASGSISNPEKSYHAEFVCVSRHKAEQLQEIMHSFQLEPKVILRKKSYVVYLKEGSQIADLLSIIEAPVALMEFENVRILKEMRNAVNRKVNCEAANIHKTVSAAVKQVEDIKYIQTTIGLHKLPDGLYEIASVRLQYPNATLKELGDLLDTPIGKSGVNHRLRKISEIVESLKAGKEEPKW